jgi:hypothetical protein
VNNGKQGGSVLGDEDQASCTRLLPPGTYEVSVGPKIKSVGPGTQGENLWVSSTPDPQTVQLKAGENSQAVFSTGEEPELTVNVEGPEYALAAWENEAVNGAEALISPTGATPGEPVPCKVEGGEDSANLLGGDVHLASCEKPLPPGSYDVSIDPRIVSVGVGSNGQNIWVTSASPEQVQLTAGANASVTFGTAFAPVPADVESGTTTNPSTPAEVGSGTLYATASGGIGTVTLGEYSSNPETIPGFSTGGQYVDVFLVPRSTFTSLSFTDCALGGGTTFRWWNPLGNFGAGEWEAVTDQMFGPGEPSCITVTMNEKTSPTIKQLTGTVFGVGLPPASTSGSTTGSGGNPHTQTGTSTKAATSTAALGNVSLARSIIAVQRGGKAAVKLACTGTATCSGKLTLTVKSAAKKGKNKKAKTEAIGTASFSVLAGQTVTIKLTLDAAGKALLKAAHGYLSATLRIVKSSPSPSNTQTPTVRLVQKKVTRATKGKK